jgi:cyclopropane-fatty-acyl-phospholipid synthase
MQAVFPESDFPHPYEILKASEDLFEVTELRNDRTHYSLTLRAWHRNLRAHLAEALAEVGEETVEFYKRYLGVAAMMFGAKNAVLLRIKMTRA